MRFIMLCVLVELILAACLLPTEPFAAAFLMGIVAFLAYDVATSMRNK